jgi:putative endonuclease
MRLHTCKPTQWHALRRRTSDLACRVWQHRSNAIGRLVQDYDLHRLVFVEFHETMADAILREKQDQERKLELIERQNPQWQDLCGELI